MIRNRLVPPLVVQMIAVTALAFSFGPARAAEPAVEGRVDDTKQMVELLKKIEQRLATAEARSDVTLDLVRTDLKQLREEVARLQRELADLRQAPAGNSTSRYPSQPATPPSVSASVAPPALAAPPAPQARIRLVNTYFTDMTATVNGLTVTVPPNEVRDVIVPAGVANYQVYQVGQPMKSTTLAANQMLTLTLFPA